MVLGLIFLVAIILIIIIIAVNPIALASILQGKQIDFRQFCLHWSMSDYTASDVTIDDKNYNAIEMCQSVNIPPEDIERCKDLCRSKT